MDTPSHPSITLSSEQRVENGVVYTDDVARQRAIAYDMLREFSAKRAAYDQPQETAWQRCHHVRRPRRCHR